MDKGLRSVYIYFLSKRFKKLSRENRIKFLLPPCIDDNAVPWIEKYIKPYRK